MTVDLMKCFDLCPPKFMTTLLTTRGLDGRIEKALMDHCQSLTRRFRLGCSCGPAFTQASGLIQGDSLSIIMVNVLFGVLRRRIAKIAPISCACYLEDFKF